MPFIVRRKGKHFIDHFAANNSADVSDIRTFVESFRAQFSGRKESTLFSPVPQTSAAQELWGELGAYFAQLDLTHTVTSHFNDMKGEKDFDIENSKLAKSVHDMHVVGCKLGYVHDTWLQCSVFYSN